MGFCICVPVEMSVFGSERLGVHGRGKVPFSICIVCVCERMCVREREREPQLEQYSKIVSVSIIQNAKFVVLSNSKESAQSKFELSRNDCAAT